MDAEYGTIPAGREPLAIPPALTLQSRGAEHRIVIGDEKRYRKDAIRSALYDYRAGRINLDAALEEINAAQKTYDEAVGRDGPRYTTRLTLRADQIGDGWQLLDAKDETTWHPVEVLDCNEEHYLDYDGQGGQLDPAYDNCLVLVSAAYGAMECHIPGESFVQVRIPAATA